MRDGEDNDVKGEVDTTWREGTLEGKVTGKADEREEERYVEEAECENEMLKY